jgi:predicted DCC family thiol-disulfide oxidoreductase YuxK
MPEREISVFFNSACPVCNAGIAAQRKRMQGCAVRWRDVHTDMNARREIASDLEFVRERLHVIDERGNIRVGMDAFQDIWRHSPGEQWKARFVGVPVIKQTSNWAYNAFARCLYRWNRRKSRW